MAAVSPYLLLLKADSRFSLTIKDVDFSTLKTLDATELPGAVNTICKDTLSERFTQTYDRIRVMRNQITHLGSPSSALQPIELLNVLIDQFAEIWPDKLWLRERREYAATSRLGFFHDGSNTSDAMEVMHEMPFILDMMKPAQFKRLFGHTKRTRRYLCPSCIHEATTDYAQLDLSRCTTAFSSSDQRRITCTMCDQSFDITEESCNQPNCQGHFKCSSRGDFQGFCLTCGEQ